jgi:hypothetical protein
MAGMADSPTTQKHDPSVDNAPFLFQPWEGKMMNFDCGGGRIRTNGNIDINNSSPTPNRLRKRKRLVSPSSSQAEGLPELEPADVLPEPEPNFLDSNEQDQSSFVLEYNRSNLDNKHGIIPFDDLIKFIDANFVCKLCGNSTLTYQRQTLGISTSINWFCCCKAGGAIKARLRDNDTKKTKSWNQLKWTRLQPTNSFELNTQFVLGLQQCGGGSNEAAVYTAMLDLLMNPYHNTWTKIEEEIAVAEVELGKQIVSDNIKQEANMKIENNKVLFNGVPS